MFRSLLSSSTRNTCGPSFSHLGRQIGNKCRTTNAIIIGSASHQSTVAHPPPPPYEKPHNVEQWEKLAMKELSKSTKTVDSLRTERITPVSSRKYSHIAATANESSHIILNPTHLSFHYTIGGNCHTACVL